MKEVKVFLAFQEKLKKKSIIQNSKVECWISQLFNAIFRLLETTIHRCNSLSALHNLCTI